MVDIDSAALPMLRLYNALLWPLRLVAEGIARLGSRGAGQEWSERRGYRFPEVPPGAVWIHGASVGEARIVTALADRLRADSPELNVIVSTVTPSGRARLPEPPDVAAAFFAPLDFPGPVRRVLRGLRPSLLVLVETELWPNLLSVARAEGVPVCIVNARLAPERMSRYRRLRVLYGPLVRNLDAVGAQDPEQERRFAELGAPRSVIEVTGNMKYDLPVPIDDRASMRRRLAIGSERPVLIAGSTAELEEAPVLDAYQRVKAKTPDALLILAPRRPERFGPAADAVAHRSLHLGRRSEGALANSETDVLLVDVLGELSSLYAAADGAFVGGSLVPVGGHNLLEPASVGVPVAFGPHTGHVEEPASSLLACGGGVRVADSAELARVWLVWATDAAERNRAGNAAKTLLEANRGALRRSVAMVNRILHQAPAGRTA